MDQNILAAALAEVRLCESVSEYFGRQDGRGPDDDALAAIILDASTANEARARVKAAWADSEAMHKQRRLTWS